MKLIPLLACFAALSSASNISSTTPPDLVPLFKATINIGLPVSPSPIPIPGGLRQRKYRPGSLTNTVADTEVACLVEPITGGVITGAINATVRAGLAYPVLYDNGTVEVPAIILYGTTHDMVPYLIQLSGIGKLPGQIARVQIDIGGMYSALADAFIVAEIKPNVARTIVVVNGFEVKQ